MDRKGTIQIFILLAGAVALFPVYVGNRGDHAWQLWLAVGAVLGSSIATLGVRGTAMGLFFAGVVVGPVAALLYVAAAAIFGFGGF